MEIEIVKLAVTSGIQIFLGTGAWFFGWRIARMQIDNQRADIRIKLFEQRYAVYRAFKVFIEHCAVSDRYNDPSLAAFCKETDKIEFLFGPEVRKYHREVVANALAVRGLMEELPCEDHPVVGGIIGYFKGSTILTDLPSLRGWFVQQHLRDLYRYFAPYLDYGRAGVNRGEIAMKPPDLPEPPLVRCHEKNDKGANRLGEKRGTF